MRIDIIDERYYTQLRNGVNFNLNLTDFTNVLQGSTGELVKLRLKVAVSYDSRALNGATFTFGAGLINSTGVDFVKDGWIIGDPFWYTVSTNLTSIFTGVVTAVNSNTLYYTVLTGTPPASGTVHNNHILRGTMANRDALYYRYGLIGNSENLNYLSKITNTEQAYGIDINFSTTPVNGLVLGGVKAYHSGNISAYAVSTSASFIRTYIIEHTFIINPIDQPALFASTECLRYVSAMEFRKTLTNPNGGIFGTYSRLGNTGYFNENNNSGNTNYTLTNLIFKDNLGNIIQRPTKSCKIEFEIDRVTGVYSSGEPTVINANFVHKGIDLTQSFESNFDTQIINTTYPNTSIFIGTIITNVVTSIITPTKLKYELTVNLSPTTLLKTDSESKLVLGVIVGDTNQNSLNNKVNVLVYNSEIETQPDISGLLLVNDFKFRQRRSGLLYTNFIGIDGDGMNLKTSIRLTNKNTTLIKQAYFRLGMFNDTNGREFYFQNVEFKNINQLRDVNGTQIINIDTTRGYSLSDTDIFNVFNFKNTTSTGITADYELNIGFRLDWQNWLNQFDADTVFYDQNKRLDGFNKRISDYDTIYLGYKLRACIDFYLENGGYTTIYRIQSPNCTSNHYNYDLQHGIINTYKANFIDNIDGLILSTEPTGFTIDWDVPLATISNDYMAFMRIEEFESRSPNNLNELDSWGVYTNPYNNNKLYEDVIGYVYIIDIIPGKIQSKCLIDPSKLDKNKCYMLSGKLIKIPLS